MSSEALKASLSVLLREKDKIERGIASLQTLIQENGEDPFDMLPAPQATFAAPATVPSTQSVIPTPERQRAPKGLLKQKILEVLSQHKTGMTPSDLRNEIVKRGYPSSNLSSLYTAIFTTCSKAEEVSKSPEGKFLLRE